MGLKIYRTRLQSFQSALFYYLLDSFLSIFVKSTSQGETNSPKNILIIRNDHIGDVILCSQAYREIKRKYPSSKITALVSPASRELLKKNPYIDEIIHLDLFWRNKNINSMRAYLKVLKKIKQKRFDVGIDIRGSLLNIFFLLWIPRIPKRVSYFNTTGGKPFLTHPIEFKQLEHTINFDADLVAKGLGFKIKNYWPEIITDREDAQNVKKFLLKNNLTQFICICPGATKEIKKWPKDRFNGLIKRLNKKYPDLKIVVCGGGDERDLIMDLSKNKNCIPLIDFNLRLLALLFRKSQLVIANDGGPMHLAWVSGAKLIAPWGPINLESIRPLKDSLVIHHQGECSLPGNLMDLITVEEVESAVEETLLQRKNKKRKPQ
jgi:ADP-heptose:LPS heptosyltransferase